MKIKVQRTAGMPREKSALDSAEEKAKTARAMEDAGQITYSSPALQFLDQGKQIGAFENTLSTLKGNTLQQQPRTSSRLLGLTQEQPIIQKLLATTPNVSAQPDDWPNLQISPIGKLGETEVADRSFDTSHLVAKN